MSIIVSLDIGTSKICAVAYCIVSQKILAIENVDNCSRVVDTPKGGYEQSASIIVECAFKVINNLARRESVDLSKISAITITGQMHGVLLVDKAGQPVSNLITWRDSRASVIAAEIGESFAETNGCGLRAGYGGASLSMLARVGAIPNGSKALSISDLLCYLLSGKIATEPTHAASWGIFDIKQSNWNWDLIDKLGIAQDVLPEVYPTSKPLGKILPSVADEFGFSRDVMIYSPIGDNQAAVIGATEGVKGTAVLNLGTGGQISIPQKEAKYIDGFETRPMPDGSFILVGASLCGGWTYAYLKDFFKNTVKEFTGVNLDDKEVYAKMDSMLVADGGDLGLCTKPLFCGTRSDPSIRGEITNIDTHNLSPSALVNSFANAMVAELADMLPQKYYKNFSSLIASGNAVRKNPVICDLINKRFGKPVSKARLLEEAAVGAAIAASKRGDR